MDYRRCGLRQFDNGIVAKTIPPSSIGLRDFARFGGGFFSFHLVKREPRANEVGFQKNFDRD
jgi:hypothetical protein